MRKWFLGISLVVFILGCGILGVEEIRENLVVESMLIILSND